MLLIAGASVHVETDKGYTPLIYNAENGNVHVLHLLLQANPKLDHTASHQGITALMMASQRGNATFVEELIKTGASIELANRFAP